ncbi:PepSY domain-containing protein [Conchiformibius steedae]|uniref:PepSY domain-containing protein n=1 Tax=Conchiformibius steedae TaxID=153493 RepID=UPI0026EF73D3|nr:PepSY domain-containing protein [Conchiformibius steedae]
MKLFSVIAVTAAVCAAQIATAAPAPKQGKHLTAQQASAIAVKHAGGGRVTDIDRKRGYYEVDVQRKGVKYEIRVNAANGRAVITDTDRDDD